MSEPPVDLDENPDGISAQIRALPPAEEVRTHNGSSRRQSLCVRGIS